MERDVWTDPRPGDVVECSNRPGVLWTVQGVGPDPEWSEAGVVRAALIEGGREVEGRVWSMHEWRDLGPNDCRVVSRGA